ncbi:MAG: phosphate ABC transporter permease subunit PstC [Gammaproteobacteria bacterium]|nr:MAG: phosphate ABC transporter permease subunit PstC [Gammaproteobacteria bacterium]
MSLRDNGRHKIFKIQDFIFEKTLLLFVLLFIFILVGLFLVLFKESITTFKEIGVLKFIFGTDWDPDEELFGALPHIYGTVVTTVIAILLATPLGFGIAIFLSELCPKRLKVVIGTLVEILAAIPSIIYGMWGLYVLVPLMSKYVEPTLHKIFENIPILNELFNGQMFGTDYFTAGVVLTFMITPFIASVTRDALEIVPPVLKESAYGLGATQAEVIVKVMFPFAKLAILGSVILALGRALGETMAVTFVVGNFPNLTVHLFDPGTTITSTIANEFGEADSELEYSALIALAFILLVVDFFVLWLAKGVFLKKAKKYNL